MAMLSPVSQQHIDYVVTSGVKLDPEKNCIKKYAIDLILREKVEQ